MAEEFTRFSGDIIDLFLVVFCLIAGLQRRSILKLSRLSWSTRLKRESRQAPYTARFCSKLSSVRSPSLEACNFPILLSRRFHRPIYFYLNLPGIQIPGTSGPVHKYSDIFESATRNVFFPDAASIHTHPANSKANPDIFKDVRAQKFPHTDFF